MDDEDEDNDVVVDELEEVGTVSAETKGGLGGFWPDGGIGWTFQ